MKVENLMLLSETADGFRATIGALQSLGEDKGVSFDTSFLQEDRCMRVFFKNLGKSMPEAEIKEKLEALHVSVQAVMQLSSNRWDRDPEKDRPLTPQFIVSVEQALRWLKFGCLFHIASRTKGRGFRPVFFRRTDTHRRVG
jgi:hypothetical protein